MKLIRISKENIEKLEDVMNMIFDEWGETFSSSKEDKLNKLKSAILNDEELPQVYILSHNDKTIGSFTFLEHELKDSDLSPWLSCVVIDKQYRGKGYGKILLDYINKTIEENFSTIYLTTEHIGFYEKAGFKLMNIINNNGKNNRLYCKKKQSLFSRT